MILTSPMIVGGRNRGSAVNGCFAVANIEWRRLAGKAQIRLVERADRSDVFPISVEQMNLHLVRVDRLGKEFSAEIFVVVAAKQVDHHRFVEDVQPHAGQAVSAVAGNAVRVDPTRLHPHAGKLLFGLRLFDESANLTRMIDLHDAQRRRIFPRDGDSRDRRIGTRLDVGSHHVAKVHSVELVARKDQHVFDPIFLEVDQILADRVGSPLIPIGSLLDGLLRRQQFDETAAEMIERVGLPQMPMQTLGQELSQDVSPIQSAVDAVADRDVDQAVLGRQRHGRFRANLCQREQTRSSATTEDQCDRF